LNAPVSKTGMGLRSIGGSNPPLSADPAVFPRLSRENGLLRTVTKGGESGSARASVGLPLGGFVPPTFPPDPVGFVHIERSTDGFQQAPERHIAAGGRSFLGEHATLARASADHRVITANCGGRPFLEVVG
jgi:hypothetical protein